MIMDLTLDPKNAQDRQVIRAILAVYENEPTPPEGLDIASGPPSEAPAVTVWATPENAVAAVENMAIAPEATIEAVKNPLGDLVQTEVPEAPADPVDFKKAIKERTGKGKAKTEPKPEPKPEPTPEPKPEPAAKKEKKPLPDTKPTTQPASAPKGNGDGEKIRELLVKAAEMATIGIDAAKRCAIETAGVEAMNQIKPPEAPKVIEALEALIAGGGA